jgi:hypothetical protein
MENTEVISRIENPTIKLSTAYRLYFTSLLLTVGVMTLGIYTSELLLIPVIIFFYISCGIYLNRKVFRNLIKFNPLYATVDNIFSTKLKSLFLWPLTYIGLLSKLTINKLI